MNTPARTGATILLACTPALAQTETASVTTPTPIPDGDPTGVVIALDIDAPAHTVTDVRLELELTHPWVGDLVVELVAPDGVTSVTLLDRVGVVPSGFPGPWGCGADDIDATFDDSAPTSVNDACAVGAQPVYAGPLRPQQALDVFDGAHADGAWTLVVRDPQPIDAGTLLRATLLVDTEPTQDPCRADIDADADVDFQDFLTLANQFGDAGAACPCTADLDDDDDVDFQDFLILAGAFGTTDCP